VVSWCQLHAFTADDFKDDLTVIAQTQAENYDKDQLMAKTLSQHRPVTGK